MCRSGNANRARRWSLIAPGIVIGLVVASATWAGFNYGEDTDAENYRGSALDGGAAAGPQRAAIQAAIDQIGAMATSDPSPRNQTTMNRIKDCLQAMLNGGRICVEGGTNNAQAATVSENPRKCTWEGDKINVRPDIFGAGEPGLSLLTAVLVHEGCHCLQWEDGSNLADTSTQREWVAYSWEVYILDRRLAEATLTQAERDRILERRNFLAWNRDALCDTTLTADALATKLGECRNHATSTTQPATQPTSQPTNYHQKPGDSSRIRVENQSASYDIQTPFARTLDFKVVPDPALPLSDLLIVCGVDISGLFGGVVMYFDNTGDGLADQATQAFIGTLPQPISLDFMSSSDGLPGQLFVLDLTSRNVYVAQAPPGGRPLNFAPTPFATPAMFPFLTTMVSVRGGGESLSGGISAIVAPFDQERDSISPSRILNRLTDTNFDLMADISAPRGWIENVVAYIPTILRDVQAGDQTVFAAGMSNRPLGVFTTNSNATTLISLLGQRFIAPPEHAAEVPITLSRPLNAGEFIVVVDMSNNQHETAGTQVHASRPEVFQTDHSIYTAGQVAQVLGRNFGASPQVLISGLTVPTTPINSNQCSFVVPSLDNTPANFFIVEVQTAAGRSPPMGIQFIPGCGTCRGDLSGNSRVDGADVQRFSACVSGGNAGVSGCGCADMDLNGVLDQSDTAAFVGKALGIGDPNPACP